MSWDLKIDIATRDLTVGFVTGIAEIMQRLTTRLQRELGEWFLDVEAGLPWYQKGQGLLGSKKKKLLDLLLRKEILGTEGILRIVDYSSLYASENRQFSISVILVTSVGLVKLLITEEGITWQSME